MIETGWKNLFRYQLKEVLPEVLSHEPKESKESPAKCVVAGIAVIRISSSLHTCVFFWALSVKTAAILSYFSIFRLPVNNKT